VIAFDYDNDGYLDLLFGNYFKPVNLLDLKDPHVLPMIWTMPAMAAESRSGATPAKGASRRFNRQGRSGQSDRLDARRRSGDFNNDGLQDIYIACDYGTDHIFTTKATAHFASD